MASIPSYAELPRPDKTGLPLAHGLWGFEDQLGMLNNITPEKAAEAAQLVKLGKRFNLDLPLDVPFGVMPPGTHARRTGPKHTLYQPNNLGLLTRDDKLDEFYLQGSSQWDGLTHVGDPDHGYYNGVSNEMAHLGPGTRNGIDRVAEFCIFTRGVLADIPAYFLATGRKWASTHGGAVSAADLAGCLELQGTKLAPGDVLLVRLGWIGDFLRGDGPERAKLFEDRYTSGISGDVDVWEYIWDNKIAALATDNVAVEIGPREVGKPSLHWAIGRLGITLGEMFSLDELSRACHDAHRFEFLFVSKPLNLRGGVGSPPNAMAVW